MDYLYIKALHVIFVVCWFAGLFYMVRLFIYTKEANEKEEPARSILTTQLTLMQKKLWFIITWPAFIGTFIFGTWMLILNPAILSFPWMWLIFLVAIVFLIIVRSTGGLVWGMLGLFIFAALLMGGVFIYKRHRRITEEKEKNNTPPTIPNN
jgi:uncharacterized integral membrane protein (TIGR00701 family)